MKRGHRLHRNGNVGARREADEVRWRSLRPQASPAARAAQRPTIDRPRPSLPSSKNRAKRGRRFRQWLARQGVDERPPELGSKRLFSSVSRSAPTVFASGFRNIASALAVRASTAPSRARENGDERVRRFRAAELAEGLRCIRGRLPGRRRRGSRTRKRTSRSSPERPAANAAARRTAGFGVRQEGRDQDDRGLRIAQAPRRERRLGAQPGVGRRGRAARRGADRTTRRSSIARRPGEAVEPLADTSLCGGPGSAPNVRQPASDGEEGAAAAASAARRSRLKVRRGAGPRAPPAARRARSSVAPPATS